MAVGAGTALAGGESKIPVGGSNAQINTNRPDLVSATLVSASQRTVRYCFDANISDNPATVNPNGNNFFLTGYDVNDVIVAQTARFDTDVGGGRCVLVQFGPGDISQFTIAVATAGAVAEQGSGRTSFQSAAALEGTAIATGPGNVSGPNLTETIVNTTLNQVTYRFDRAVNTANGAAGSGQTAPIPNSFGFYSSSNQAERRGQSIVSVTNSNRDVTVQFTAGVQPVSEGVRFFAEDAAVTALTPSNDPNGTDVLGRGTAAAGPTTRPDLQSAGKVSGTAAQYDLVYDVSVVAGNPANCRAFFEDGQSVAAAAINTPGAATVIRVTFNTPADEKIVRIGDTGGCAVERDTPSAPSSIGEAAVRTANKAPGFTDGPDLQQCTVNTGSNSVTFRFDQTLATNPQADATRFFIVDPDGNRVAGNAGNVIGQTQNTVTIQYTSSQIASAVGCAVEGALLGQPAAVRDPQGKSNSEGTLAFGGTFPGTTGTTSTTGSAGPTSTTGSTATTTGTTTGTTGSTAGTTDGTTAGTTTGTTSTTSTTGTTSTSGTTTTTTTTTSGTPTTTATTGTPTTTTTGTTTPPGIRIAVRAVSLRASVVSRGRSFIFDLSGAISPARRVRCSGRVSLRVRAGRRTVASRNARVGSNCRYRIRIRISKSRFPRRLRQANVLSRYGGSTTLLPRRGRTAFVTLPRRR